VSRAETLTWLAEFQARFSELLREPLDRSSGELRARSDRYPRHLCEEVAPPAHCTAHERLAVYHRQYWFRLFTVLQAEYRLTARLLGMWRFNELAASYLREHPPAHYDLQHVTHSFVAFLQTPGSLDRCAVPIEPLLEAATIDEAFGHVFRAPPVQPFPLAAVPPHELTRVQLTLAPSVALLCEHWPLLQLRQRILHQDDERAVALPPPLEGVQHWTVFRTPRGHGMGPLEPIAFRLFTLLSQLPFGQALAELEASCDEQQKASLPALVQRLLAQSVKLEFWAASA
jgi:hypothetical protein